MCGLDVTTLRGPGETAVTVFMFCVNYYIALTQHRWEIVVDIVSRYSDVCGSYLGLTKTERNNKAHEEKLKDLQTQSNQVPLDAENKESWKPFHCVSEE